MAASRLLAPSVEATRSQPASLSPSLGPPVALPVEPVAGPSFELLTDDDRFLFAALSNLEGDEVAQVLDRRRFRPLSRAVNRDLTSGLSTHPTRYISLGTRDLRWESHQGDYFLEPDPLGPVDSPNLYQAFGFDGLNITDPYGECWFTADNQSCMSSFVAIGQAWIVDTPLDVAKGVGNLATLGIAGRMYHEYTAGNVNSFADTMRVAGDAVTNTVTLGGRDMAEQGATGGQIAKEISGVAGIERGSQTIGEGIGLGDGEMFLSGVGEFAGGVGQVAGWSAGAVAVGKRALSAVSMDEIAGAAQSGLQEFGREMGAASRSVPRTATQLRNSAGVASGGSRLPTNPKTILRGTEGNAGVIPREIAERLTGRRYASFKSFRETFWRTVADSPYAAEFQRINVRNLSRMRKGYAPLVSSTQMFKGQFKFILHHRRPISHGGGVFDIENLTITSPRYHAEVLEAAFHAGR
jgi:hypothetical protein